MIYFPNCQSVRGKHWNPPCDYLVGTLVTLVAIFTSQSIPLFGGMTSRRFCTCSPRFYLLARQVANLNRFSSNSADATGIFRNIQEYFTMVSNMCTATHPVPTW